mmetsp:Transcript_136541/g.251113  ORF Transcript_136541/g.251113 Transcript_136541/m.251113 type:complete len:247 (+) Transcript_136541:127-867(+)
MSMLTMPNITTRDQMLDELFAVERLRLVVVVVVGRAACPVRHLEALSAALARGQLAFVELVQDELRMTPFAHLVMTVVVAVYAPCSKPLGQTSQVLLPLVPDIHASQQLARNFIEVVWLPMAMNTSQHQTVEAHSALSIYLGHCVCTGREAHQRDQIRINAPVLSKEFYPVHEGFNALLQKLALNPSVLRGGRLRERPPLFLGLERSSQHEWRRRQPLHLARLQIVDASIGAQACQVDHQWQAATS